MLALLALAGCASMLSTEQLARFADDDICDLWNRPGGRIEKVRSELDRRALISAGDWELVEESHIRVGMGRCALLASWGYPSRVHRSAGFDRASEQWVYDRGYSASSTYVYIERGEIVAWQD
jgi:hypothetical protein